LHALDLLTRLPMRRWNINRQHLRRGFQTASGYSRDTEPRGDGYAMPVELERQEDKLDEVDVPLTRPC